MGALSLFFFFLSWGWDYCSFYTWVHRGIYSSVPLSWREARVSQTAYTRLLSGLSRHGLRPRLSASAFPVSRHCFLSPSTTTWKVKTFRKEACLCLVWIQASVPENHTTEMSGLKFGVHSCSGQLGVCEKLNLRLINNDKFTTNILILSGI
jgi:hypothetical protein